MSSPAGGGTGDVGDVASTEFQRLAGDALGLPLDSRRELTLSLLWSLPRDDVIHLHTSLTRMLQRDIIGSLPPELSLLILGQLELRDILQCGLVSKQWRELCNEQKLWATLCASSTPPISPRRTTWQDLDVHQQLLHQSKLPRSDSIRSDEGGFDSSGSNDGTSPDTPEEGYDDVIDSQGGLGGGGGVDFFQRIWDRGRNRRLPTYLHPSSVREYRTTPNPTAATTYGRRASSTSGSMLALERVPVHCAVPASSLALPSPMPQPNYKHLLIVHDILSRRFRGEGPYFPGPSSSAGLPRGIARSEWPIAPRVIDSLSSLEAGGLPGHTETVYCLKLIARPMQITMKLLEGDFPWSPSTSLPMYDTVLASSRARSHSEDTGPITITARDWLLSGSRDLTLRLWNLASPTPKVVKVFYGGHTGSVLSLDVFRVPVPRSERAMLAPRGSPARRAGLSGAEAMSRVMAISAGGDGRLCLWDIEHGDGKPEKVVQAHEEAVYCVRADDERIVSCSKDRTIRVFDIETLEERLTIPTDEDTPYGGHGAVNAVAISKDFIITVSGDKSIRVRDIHTGILVAGIVANTRGIASLDFAPAPAPAQPARPSPSARHPNTTFKGSIIIGTSDSCIKTFHLVSHAHTNLSIVDALDIVPPMRNMTFEEMLHDADDVSMVPEDEAADESESQLRIEAAGQCWAACICSPGLAQPDGSACQKCLNRGHTDLVRSLVLGEKHILSGSYDSTVKVWDRQSGHLLLDLHSPASGRVFAVAGDKTRIVCSGLDSRLTLWDFARGLDTAFVVP